MSSNFNGVLPYTEEEYYNFIGREKSSYYIPKFELMKDVSKLSWNWAAFFFGPIWILYRKIYTIGIVTLIINTVSAGLLRNRLDLLLLLLEGFGFGCYGNWFYYKQINNKLKNIRSMIKDEDLRKEAVVDVGGVNVIIPIVYIVIFVIMNFISIVLKVLQNIWI